MNSDDTIRVNVLNGTKGYIFRIYKVEQCLSIVVSVPVEITNVLVVFVRAITHPAHIVDLEISAIIYMETKVHLKR